jgi:hypothetical protein
MTALMAIDLSLAALILLIAAWGTIEAWAAWR